MLERQLATLRSFGIVSATNDATDDTDRCTPLADVSDASDSDDSGDFATESEFETIPPEQAPPNIDLDETPEEDKEGGFAEESKVCCEDCKRWRRTSQYDTPTQLRLDASPVRCSTIGRSCSEPDDRLDMGVTTRTIVLDRRGKIPSNIALSERQMAGAKRVTLPNGSEALVVEADESLLFNGIDGLDKECDYMEMANLVMVQIVGSNKVHMVHRELLVGVPPTPPGFEPENRTLSRYERFIKTATEDREHNQFHSKPCATICAKISGHTVLLPSESELWAAAKSHFAAVIDTMPAKAGYERLSYGGGSCAKEGMRVKSLIHPLSSYLFGWHSRQIGLVANVRAFYLEVKVPASTASHRNLSEIEKRWVAALRNFSGVVLINGTAVGNGGYANAVTTDGVVSIFLECVVWNEYVGNGEAGACPRTAFFRNSTSIRLKFGKAATMRALGIDGLRDGTVELRCYRFHPVSGYQGSIKKKEDGSYEFDEAGVLEHHAKGLICCARCSQLGFGLQGTGFRDYRCYQIERVMEEDGTIWTNNKDRKPKQRDLESGGSATLSMPMKSRKRPAKTAKRKKKKKNMQA